jgi:GT2 family glycosyltransferase
VLDYRKADLTGRCLASLMGEGLDTVYVVDNSADAGHSRKLTETLKKIRNQGIDYNIVAINPGLNLGFAAGVNFVIRTDLDSAAPHDRYLLINNDATAEAGLLTRLQQAMVEDSRTCIVAPAVVSGDSETEYNIWYNRYLGLLTRKPTPLSFEYASGCCLLVDKAALQGDRLFDPVFFMYCEDAYLCWRLQRDQQLFRVVENARVHHEVGASSKKAGLFYEYHTARGHILMAFKAYRHPLEIPLMLACRLVTLSLRSITRCIRYRSLVPAWALLLAWYPASVRIN